jgi:hypothetical protein
VSGSCRAVAFGGRGAARCYTALHLVTHLEVGRL